MLPASGQHRAASEWPCSALRGTLHARPRLPARPRTHLGPVVAEDAHGADGHGLVQTAPQRFAVERKHERDALLAGAVDDGVQRVVQPAWSGTGQRPGDASHAAWRGPGHRGIPPPQGDSPEGRARKQDKAAPHPAGTVLLPAGDALSEETHRRVLRQENTWPCGGHGKGGLHLLAGSPLRIPAWGYTEHPAKLRRRQGPGLPISMSGAPKSQ